MSHDQQTGDDRDHLEGTYTESNDAGPEERTVHGQYTESAEFDGPQKETDGSYTDTDDEAEVSTADEQGDYTGSERP